MKRLAALVFSAAALVTTAAASSMVQPDQLKELCERICGGTWEPTAPPVPDQFVTSYSYEWDAPLGLIRGKIVTMGGVAGIHRETAVLYGVDPVTKTIWMFEGDGEGRPRYGAVELTGDGRRETLEILGSDLAKATLTYVFNGADEFAVTAESITPQGPVTSTTDTYRRVTH